MMNFKPMLAADASEVPLEELSYPLVISPKLDGIRCIVWEGVAYSRNAKPIRNRAVQEWASDWHNLDGELIVGDPTGPNVLGFTQSGVMSAAGFPDFKFYLFDTPDRFTDSFILSLHHAQSQMAGESRIVNVKHYAALNADELRSFEQQYVDAGYEGIMLRHPYGPYKNGRSTLNEGWLMKLKRFSDGEAVVLRVEEGRHNNNELMRDELGRAKRTTHKENMVGNEHVGTLICLDPKWGELRVAPGRMDHASRRYYFEHPEAIIGQTIHWRSFGYGIKDMPRFPRFYGFRGEE